MLNSIRALTQGGSIWPPIDAELADVRHLLRGKVLNAGAGWREDAHLVDGQVVNQDITWDGDDRTNIDIVAPIHRIPVEDGHFDAALCIAVLEHVSNPDECVAELYRVTRPGGFIIASVPFMQPEHKVPTDYQRYTKDGLELLFCSKGFQVVECRSWYNVYHTLHWILRDLLDEKNTLLFKAMRYIFLVPLAILARRSNWQSDKISSVFRIVCKK